MLRSDDLRLASSELATAEKKLGRALAGLLTREHNPEHANGCEEELFEYFAAGVAAVHEAARCVDLVLEREREASHAAE